MTPIKVLQVFTILNRGGAETNLMNYYRQMDRSKFQIDFLVHRQEEGAYEPEIKKLGGEIFRLPALHPLHIKEYKAAVKKFFDDNSGYQIIHGQCSELGIFIYQEAKKRKIPVIIAHAHNYRMDWDEKSIFRIFWKHQMRKYINAYFTCGSDSARWLFGEKLARNAYEMKNAVNAEDFIYTKDVREIVRKRLNAEETLNIIHIGRFNPQKNHKFLIGIFSEIIKLKPTSKLFLVGSGDLQKEIILQVRNLNLQDKVEFLGVRSDISSILQAMDIFLFPSLYEGFGVANLEAQASGLKCVISDMVAKESNIVKENVLIVKLSKSARYWAENIITFATGERKDVSQNIKDAGYDINDNVTKLEEKYMELYQQFR